MAYDENMALDLVKSRRRILNLPPMDEMYTRMRIRGAAERLEKNGIHLRRTDEDLTLLVDMTVWEINNRDKGSGMPDWLRLVRRERFLSDGGAAQEDGDVCDP